ncbi:MAG: SDR family NAD(P)-dependent oxidoreductase, partial [Candidatus Neomarinimicrobiota bacterium]|nr:SDR family NAD(P)-dependent oxidoreductase [Candidatus Neomarinimicrobiota bacterium]
MFEKDILKNKVVLITGGGTGLGKSMAMRFAELGASLVIASRRKEVISEAKSQIKEIGAEALGLQCDVRDTDQVNSMVIDTLNQFNKIDILINNAATIQTALFQMTTQKDLKKVFQVNVFSQVLFTQ